MNSQFGLTHIWDQGDLIIKAIALLLLLMSLASWTVIIIKTLDLFKHKKNARIAQQFWNSSNFTVGLQHLSTKPGNPFCQLALQGQEAALHHNSSRTLHDDLDASDWLTRCLRYTLDEITSQLQSGLAILASVGSTAPFVGLFGTVWGIYHALLSIGAAGQASLDQVAGPVGEALIMTALGLAVAIPAVLGYNALLRGNKGLTHQLNRFAHDLHAYFMTGARVKNHR